MRTLPTIRGNLHDEKHIHPEHVLIKWALKLPTKWELLMDFAPHFMDSACYALSNLDPWTDPPQLFNDPMYICPILSKFKRALIKWQNMRPLTEWKIFQNFWRSHQKMYQSQSVLGTNGLFTAFYIYNISQFLFNKYWVIHSKDLEANDVKWSNPWNPYEPIEFIFKMWSSAKFMPCGLELPTQWNKSTEPK